MFPCRNLFDLFSSFVSTTLIVPAVPCNVKKVSYSNMHIKSKRQLRCSRAQWMFLLTCDIPSPQ